MRERPIRKHRRFPLPQKILWCGTSLAIMTSPVGSSHADKPATDTLPQNQSSPIAAPRIYQNATGKGLIRRFRVPGGWEQQQVPGGSDQNAVEVVGFKQGKSELTIVFSPPHPDPEDSRRLGLYAARYAATWGLKLKQWVTPKGITIQETRRSFPKAKEQRFILSAVSDSLEALIFTRSSLASPITEASFRADSRQILATIVTTGRATPFPALPIAPTASPVPIPATVSAATLKIYGQRLTIPPGWIPYGMSVPGAEDGSGDSDSSFRHITLLHRKPEITLSVYWTLRSTNADRFRNQTLNRKNLLQEAKQSGAQIHTEIISGVPLTRTRSGPNNLRVQWFSVTDSISLYATVTLPQDDALPYAETAVKHLLREVRQ